jgi:STE24 endopeptidase
MKKNGLSVPPEFEGSIDENLLKKVESYEADKIRFSFISSLFGNIVTVLFIFAGFLDMYNSWIASLNLTFIVSGLIFYFLISCTNSILSIPFDLYSTFQIENKYGFNAMTPKLWIADFIKSFLLSTVITGVVLSVAFWLIQSSPYFWWVWVWVFFLIFSLFIMYISPYVIEPLFNKFSPLEVPELEERIKTMMQQVNINVSRVFRMDASKRSRHTNAYFSGIGKTKRIILYDTLLERMDHAEILAILAHEAGHWKKKHVLKMLVGMEIISFAVIYLSYRLLQSDILINLFRIQQETFFAKTLLLGFIGSILSFLFTPLGSYISRRFEREADRFACQLSRNKEAMASAFIKLSKDNLSNLHPHPLYASFYYSHPPVVERIRGIRKV